MLFFVLFGSQRKKSCLQGFANNKGPDQHAQSEKCLFIRSLESNISKLATGGISIFYLVFVAEQAGLNLTFSETPKTGFVVMRPIYCYLVHFSDSQIAEVINDLVADENKSSASTGITLFYT